MNRPSTRHFMTRCQGTRPSNQLHAEPARERPAIDNPPHEGSCRTAQLAGPPERVGQRQIRPRVVRRVILPIEGVALGIVWVDFFT